MDAHFTRNKTIHPTDVSILAAETNLTEEEVQVLFLLLLYETPANVGNLWHKSAPVMAQQHRVAGHTRTGS